MSDKHFTETLQSVLDDPPLPAGQTDSAAFTASVTQGVRRRRTRHLAAASLAAAAVAAGIIIPTTFAAGSGHHTTQQAGAPGHAPQHSTTKSPAKESDSVLATTDIVNMIMSAAADMKDPTPTAIQFVYGTRNDLSTFISQDTVDGTDGQAPAVLVEATGNFTMTHSAPAGHSNTTTGTAIVLIIDQQTGNVTDQGIIGQPIDLAPLGQVFHPAVPK